jgi:hypothetical protein
MEPELRRRINQGGQGGNHSEFSCLEIKAASRVNVAEWKFNEILSEIGGDESVPPCRAWRLRRPGWTVSVRHTMSPWPEIYSLITVNHRRSTTPSSGPGRDERDQRRTLICSRFTIDHSAPSLGPRCAIATAPIEIFFGKKFQIFSVI